MIEKCRTQLLDLFTFKEVELSDMDIFTKITKATKNIISGYDFVNFYLWSGKHDGRIKFHENRIYIYYGDIDALFYPIGMDLVPVEDLVKVSDCMRQQGSTGNFIYVDYDFINSNKKQITEYFNIVPDDNNSDYIYSIESLIELKGKKLKKKRNLIKQFTKNINEYEVKRLNSEHFDGCMDLAKWWARYKDSNNNTNFEGDIIPLKKALENYNELKLDGICIVIDDTIVAFNIFNEQTEDTAICHFEKYCPEIKGSSQLINQEAAKLMYNEGYKYINREQDLGIEGLKKAKESYEPIYKKNICKLIRK